MSDSREIILKRLRAAQSKPVPPTETRLNVVPMSEAERDPAALRERFIIEAEKLSAKVSQASDEAAALSRLIEIIGEDKQILSWDFPHIPLNGLATALTQNGISIAPPRTDGLRVGVTGAEVALASTGSLVLKTGAGKPRSASLLPHTHVAIIRAEQILPDFETWISQERAAGLSQFQATANVVIISGPSRTADIAFELVMGAHGPAALEIILVG